jgi:Arc/MetJ-type ribon-helix-helix transcriptional regulator
MEIRPSPDQEAFIRDAIASGRFDSAEAVGKEAMALWEERERRRLETLAMVAEAEASIARGEGIEIAQESMRKLAEEVKQRGRERLAAKRNTAR